MRTIFLVLAVAVLLASTVTVKAQEQQVSISCLTAEEVRELLSERGGVWQYAAEDRLIIRSSDCVSRDGNTLRYKDPLDNREMKVQRVGTEKYGHWYRIKGAGSGKVRGSSYLPSLWIDIYLDPKHTLALIKWLPPVETQGDKVLYRILLWFHEPDAVGNTWTGEANYDPYSPYPHRNADGDIEIYGYYRKSMTLEQARAFKVKYVPALMDFIEAGFFDTIPQAGAKAP